MAEYKATLTVDIGTNAKGENLYARVDCEFSTAGTDVTVQEWAEQNVYWVKFPYGIPNEIKGLVSSDPTLWQSVSREIIKNIIWVDTPPWFIT